MSSDTDPVSNILVATPSDTVDLPSPCRAVRCGVAGNLRVLTMGGQDVTLTNVSTEWQPIRVRRIFATGTTATGIHYGN